LRFPFCENSEASAFNLFSQIAWNSRDTSSALTPFNLNSPDHSTGDVLR
jgi:hypothetical protein